VQAPSVQAAVVVATGAAARLVYRRQASRQRRLQTRPMRSLAVVASTPTHRSTCS